MSVLFRESGTVVSQSPLSEYHEERSGEPTLLSGVGTISIIRLKSKKEAKIIFSLVLRMLSSIMGDFVCHLRRAIHYTKWNSFSDGIIFLGGNCG